MKVKEMNNAEARYEWKTETVDIDGISFDEKELKFKAEDIKKKGETEYFVNVEGAEQRKKEAARKAKKEAAANKEAADKKPPKLRLRLKPKNNRYEYPVIGVRICYFFKSQSSF